jgi:hypothetical protein
MAETEAAVEDVVGTIRAMDRKFMVNVAAKDSARVAGAYANDARILMPGRPVKCRVRKRASMSPSTVASRLATGRWPLIRTAAMGESHTLNDPVD